MGAGHLARQQELDRRDHRVGGRPLAVEAWVEELERAALLAIGTTSPDSRTIASREADGHMWATALPCGCFVILLASSHRPWIPAACIRSWKSLIPGLPFRS